MKKSDLKRFYKFVDLINYQDFIEKVKDDLILRLKDYSLFITLKVISLFNLNP